ncbi:MAG TPA: YfhO family protein [Aggregatilinea sp.]|uniref:YfhO family protein n=1 Tax=Aggregatilinea sp. TaxID=2806333 RepID=UPI002C018367|nr:YfhO family protein [Aggregatilinea sp.]HML24820.1 YfhO family protein [Aggregatilinea sp.]
MTKRNPSAWLPALLLIAAAIALFHKLLGGDTLFWGLPSLQFDPWRHFAFEEIRHGRLPGWNPYAGAGAPLIANYQSAIFYPPNWLYLLGSDAAAMSVSTFLHLALAGTGMWGFTGALGMGHFGRGVSMLAFALSGYLIGRAGSFATFDAAIWIPWVFWMAHRALARRTWRNAGLLALVVGLQLLTGVGLYALWLAIWGLRGIPARTRWTGLAMVAAGAALGAGIAAVQVIPTAEYLMQSQRAGGLDFDFTTNLSYAPLRLVTLFSPNFYGTPADGSYLTKGIYFEDAAYIGFFPLLLALAAMIRWMRTRRAEQTDPAAASVPFWALLALVALVLAMGRHTPIFKLLFTYVPTFDVFREPVRWLILTAFALAVLAGIGAQHVARGKWLTFWSRLSVAGGLAMAALALAAPMITDTSHNVEVLSRGVAALGCGIALSALLVLAKPQTGSRAVRRWQAAVLIVVTADLVWASSGLNPTAPAEFYQPAQVTNPTGRLYWFDAQEESVKFDDLFVLGDYRVARDDWRAVRTSRLPNLNMLDGIRTLNNFDPLLPDHHRRYIDLIEELGPKAGPLLKAASVTETLGDTRPAGWQGTTPDFTAPDETPRAWLVGAAEWAAADDAIEDLLRRPDWDPQTTVILAGSPPADAVSSGSPQGTVTVVDEQANRLALQVESDGLAYLVISTTWYPGWNATIDGQDAEIYRANLAFQAIAVPAGSTEVTLTFRPNGIVAGAVISAVALALALVCIAWRPRRAPDSLIA